MVIMARRGCQRKGIITIPLKFKAPTVAVKSTKAKVKRPPYIINGLPKIKV